jgi:ketosteroid isomerase-like protein
MKDQIVDNIIRSQVIEDYLQSFEDKDIDSVMELFSEECSLHDWNVGVIGKDNLARFFLDVFDTIENIEVNITHIHEDLSGTLICEMILSLDETNLSVADIFEFDEEDKIKSLRAYMGGSL